MALVNLKSNLANFRSEFTTPSVASQTVNNLGQPSKPHINKASDSNLDIDSIPKSYSGRTNFTKSFINSSLFERADAFILKYTGRTGFTQNVINTSKFNIDSNPVKFSLQGMYTPSKFNTNSVVNKSKFNIDLLPSKFSLQGIYSPSKFNTNSVVNKSKFNIDSLPTKFSTSTKFTPTSLYPESKVKSGLRWTGKQAPVVNFFDDKKSGASGFTTKFTTTKFTGATATSYTYPNLLGLGDRLVARPLTNSKFPNAGVATLANQLPMGSVFHYAKDGVIVSKKFSTQGYSEKRKYSDNVKSIKGQSDKSLLFTRSTEKNSPSAIDQQYAKFNLRDEAFNPTYIKTPLILRGIQRKEKHEPQRWGTGASFDDGLIRGGAITAIERAAIDTARIAKWIASPKGLLWVVKQVGLGLTNPKVEAIGGTFGRQTRIHTGVTSLLSVFGSPFGLHFTSHGLPFVNEFASYENVIKTKQNPLTGNPSYSRLIDLQSEFGTPGKFYTNKVIEGLNKVKALKTKSGSAILSGLGGPGSVYGLGFTQIRRVVDTKTDAVARAASLNFKQTYNINAQYASGVSNTTFKSASPADNSNTAANVDVQRSTNTNERDSLNTRLSKVKSTPGAGNGNNIETNEGKVAAYPNSPKNDINNYITMAYGKIPKDSSAKASLKGDFRNALAEDKKGFTGKKKDENYYTNNSLETKYGFGNLGQVGADRTDPNKFIAKGNDFGKDRAIIIKDKSFRGDKVNALDVNLSDGIASNQVYAKGGNDLIKFYFQDGAVAGGTNGNVAVMAFRATMTGFTDSFAPGWDRIDIMGRPDGAYLYNSFERNVSFNFIVAATSRSEMIPMWRKLNYLASYTMPDFNGNAKPSGPFMRITIGDLFQQTPGFITSLSYTIPDDATWDIAEDAGTNKDAKQLPMVVEASISFTIVGDYRPQMHGRVYSLSPGGVKTSGDGQWLGDSSSNPNNPNKPKAKQ